MNGKLSAIGAPPLDAFAPDDVVGLLGFGVVGAVRRLDVLQREVELIIADALRRAAELRAAQHRDDVIEPLVLRGETVDLAGQSCVLAGEAGMLGIDPGGLGARGIGFVAVCQDHGLQQSHVVGQVFDLHRHAGENR